MFETLGVVLPPITLIIKQWFKTPIIHSDFYIEIACEFVPVFIKCMWHGYDDFVDIIPSRFVYCGPYNPSHNRSGQNISIQIVTTPSKNTPS